MSDNSKRPLTRREIREREQAAAAAAAAAAAQGDGAGAGGGQAPDAPAAAPPSRRALRDRTSAQQPADRSPFSTPAPVVRPPSTSGGIRRVDETGRLTPVERASGDAGPGPAAPQGDAPARPGAPARTSSRQPFSGPAAPSAPYGRPAPGSSGAAQAPPPPPPWASTGTSSVGASAASAAAAQEPPSPFGAPAAGGPDRRPSPDLPWEAPPARPAAEQQPPRTRAEARVDPDEDDWEEPESSYTWLHYIVLVVVAFVLGLLLWKLLLDGSDESFQTDQQAAPAVTTLHTVRDGGVL